MLLPAARRPFHRLIAWPASLVASVAILITAAPVSGSVQQRPVPALFAAIQVSEPDTDRWVEALADAGLNAVQVTLYARQGRWDSGDLRYERSVPSVIDEIRTARERGLRTVLVMRVALEHAIAENRHLWHGMIWPRQDDLARWFDAYRAFVLWGATVAEQESVDLFTIGNEMNSMASTTPVDELPPLYAYYLDERSTREVRSRLVRCDEALAREGSTQDLTWLDGGRYFDLDAMLRAEQATHRAWVTEVLGATDDARRRLDHLNRRRASYGTFWGQLIEEVRRAYGGPITYGANFDQFEEVGFWGGLDALGVNAYFPLSLAGLEGDARRSYMRTAWETVAHRLQRSARVGEANLPVVLLELGWTRKVGSTIRPYSYQRVEVLETAGGNGGSDALTCVHWASQPEDPSERVDALAALRDLVASGGFPALRGFTLWKLSTLARHRAIEPFVVVLPSRSPALSRADHETGADHALDRAFLLEAAAIARSVQDSIAKWQNGTKPSDPSFP